MPRATYQFAELDQDVFTLLKQLGYQPQVIFDIGASNGYWSRFIHEVLPDAEYHLFEPLSDYIPDYGVRMKTVLKEYPDFQLYKFALGDQVTDKTINLYSDGFSSTVVEMDSIQGVQQLTVPMMTLDAAIAKFNLPCPQVIKADIQGFELAMLKGAKNTLPQVDVLLLESWLSRGYGPGCGLLIEIANWLLQFDFYLWDFAEYFRDDTGKLYTVDCVFVNGKNLPQLADPKVYAPRPENIYPPQQVELEQLKLENHALQQEILEIKSSKFWQLRSQWMQLKQAIGAVK